MHVALISMIWKLSWLKRAFDHLMLMYSAYSYLYLCFLKKYVCRSSNEVVNDGLHIQYICIYT